MAQNGKQAETAGEDTRIQPPQPLLCVDDADATNLARLLTQLTGRVEIPQQVAAQVNKLVQRENIQLMVARHADGQIVGMVCGYLCPHMSPQYSPFVMIEGLVVDEHFRRRGIATALMCSLEKWAEKHSAKYITLASQISRGAAHAFYTNLGYRPDAAFQKFYI